MCVRMYMVRGTNLQLNRTLPSYHPAPRVQKHSRTAGRQADVDIRADQTNSQQTSRQTSEPSNRLCQQLFQFSFGFPPTLQRPQRRRRRRTRTPSFSVSLSVLSTASRRSTGSAVQRGPRRPSPVAHLDMSITSRGRGHANCISPPPARHDGSHLLSTLAIVVATCNY